MPTPIQITKYCCNVCGYPYEQYNTAIMCEGAAMIPEHEVHHVGQEMMFDAEDIISDTRTMSTIENGLVLAKVYLTIKNAEGFFEHHVAYVVKCRINEDGGWEERMVMWTDDQSYENGKKLYSHPSLRYERGYHQNMPKHLRLIDHINTKIDAVPQG